MVLGRTLVLTMLCLFFPVASSSGAPPECPVSVATEVAFDLESLLADSYAAKQCRERSECCKVCDKGKACGNSCIR